MKVLLTLDFPPATGGIQRHLYGIVKHLYTDEDRVVAAGARKTTLSYSELPARVTYVRSFAAQCYDKLALFKLAFLYASLTGRDCETQCGNVYAAIIPWALRRPYSVYAYATELIGLRRSGLRSALLRRVLNASEKLFVLGSYTKSLLDAAGVRCPTEVTPPRIETSAEKVLRRVDQRTSRPESPVLSVLSVGRLAPHKGHDILIDALSGIGNDMPWRLTIVGSGQMADSLRDQCRARGALDRVEILENIPNDQLHHHYAYADVFVLPSRETAAGSEGFGVVLLEAMSFAVPIVASDCGGIPEALADTGLLAPPGDPVALGQAIARLARDRELRHDLIRNAAARLLEHYVW